MTEEHAIKLLQNLKDADTEHAHVEADKILCKFLKKLGYGELIKEYDKIYKWYA